MPSTLQQAILLLIKHCDESVLKIKNKNPNFIDELNEIFKYIIGILEQFEVAENRRVDSDPQITASINQ